MERMICQCCGEALRKHDDIYECRYCGATYRDDQAERAAGLLRGLLDDFKIEQLSNARRRLYETTHEKYPSSQAVTQAAGAVLSISPDDFMARVYLHSHDSDPHELISLLARGTVSEWEAKETLAWLIRSLDMRALAAVKDFADRHLEGVEKTNALIEIEDEALKLDSGVYDLSLKRDVFLCYSTDDMPRVIEIMETFEENALSCFAAFRNLRHGKGAQENYQEAIFRAMGNCRVFVFLSSNSSRDPHRKAIVEELDHLISDLKDKPRVEFLLEDYPGRTPFLAKRRLEEAFPHLEHCRDVEDLLVRVSGLLDAEENAEKNRVKKIAEEASERAKKELQAEFEAREAARKEEQAKRQRELEERLAKEREEQAKRQKELEERLAKEREEQAKRQKELEERLAKDKEERERKQRELDEERLRLEKEKLEVEKRRIEAQKESSALPPGGGTMDAESMLAMMEKAEELKRKRAEEAANKKKAEPAVDAIKAIGSVEYSPKCKSRIDMARKAYDALTTEQRAFVHNADALLTAEREYGEAEEAADKKKAGAVVDAIEAIGKVELTPKCRVRINTARAYYSGLTERQRAHVHNADVLLAAEREYRKAEEAAVKKKAEPAVEAIEAIGGVEYSPKCKARIDEAQRLYDALIMEQRAFVHNAEILQRASQEYAKLEEEAAKPIEAIFDMEILPDGNASVAKCRNEKITGAAIPERYRGRAVTSIGKNAFHGCTSLKSIAIPEGVTSIGVFAFDGCESLTSIAIPSSVTSIGEEAFSGCKSLTSVAIAEGVTSIGEGAFRYCGSLKSIAIPESVTSIGGVAFYGCHSLKSITIPNGVTSIGWGAFNGCSFLESIKVDPSNPKFDSRGGCNAIIETETNVLLRGCVNTVIPSSVTSIGEYAFFDCRSLTSITIPSSVTSIGRDAFSDCTSLKSIAIPKGVTSIGGDAFWNCESLASIEIPDSVTSIGKDAFRGCSLLAKNLGLGVDSMKTISAAELRKRLNTFAEARNKENASNAEKAIKAIKAIGSVEYSPKCKSRIDEAQRLYDALPEKGKALVSNHATLVSARAEFEKLEAEAEESARLRKEEDEAAKPIEAIFDMEILPDGNASVAKCRDKEATGAAIPESYRGRAVTSIGGEAFRGCKSLTSIAIPESVTSIGGGAFFECSSLTSIAIPESVTSIGVRAFNGCESLTSITIPSSVTSIGEDTFEDCKSLKSITIPSGVTSIGNWAFNGCESLSSIAIPSSVTSIGDGAFNGCESLTSIAIPSSVTFIGERAFSYCESLTSIAIPSSVTFIGERAFWNCHSLTSITIPESVTSIGEYAFSGCSSLSSIIIPESVTSIGEYAFSGCSALKSIAIPSSVASIGKHAFERSYLKSIIIPESVTSIGEEAFSRCSCAIHFAHKKPLFGYPKGFSKDCLKDFKGQAFWGGK